MPMAFREPFLTARIAILGLAGVLSSAVFALAKDEGAPAVVQPGKAYTAAGEPTDWPCWLGPNKNGTSDDKGLLREWPAKGPEVLWRAPVDMGWNTPVVFGGDVFVHQAKFVGWGTPTYESVVCFDAKTGDKKWGNGTNVMYNDEKKGWGCGWIHGGPRATPLVTDKYIYTLGALGLFSCRNKETGALVWEIDLDKKYNHFNLRVPQDWKGTLLGPAIAGKVLILNVQLFNGKKSISTGLEPDTGKEIWQYEVNSKVFDSSGKAPKGQVSAGRWW